MDGKYNTRSPAVKRLMREAQELSEPTDQYFAQPLDDNLFEWHFTVRGPADSDFQNGIYHGRIILPVDYPMKPPSIIWLTPNGRFETYKKICLSISGHHPESWQPSWSIRTALLAIIGFMPTHPGGAIGSLDYTPEERKLLAKKSKDWKCPTCGDITGILLEVSENSEQTSRESKELAAQINLQGEKPKCKEAECPVEQARLAEVQSQASGAGAHSQTSSGSTDSGKYSAESSAVANSNTSNPAPDVNYGQVLPPLSAVPQAAALPPWSPGAAPFPLPPMGFPIHYPALPTMPPMQFPYPPSHYATAPQSGWPVPPGMAPFLASFPPPPPLSPSLSPSQLGSTNSDCSPAQGNQGLPDSDNVDQASMQCRHTPGSLPPSADISSNSNSGSTEVKQEDVLKELLSRVKRVGSETKPGQLSSAVGASWDGQQVPMASSQQLGISDTPTVPINQDQTESTVYQSKNDELLKRFQEGDTDSDVSKSVRKLTDVSISDMGDTNTEDNSECGVPQIEGSEVDQRSHLEKSACSSTSDLERGKQKYQINKVLRQRQSVPTGVPGEVSEAAAREQERSESNAARQRIEAVSGDTTLRNRPRQGLRLVNNLNAANVPAGLRLNRGMPHDFTFYVMLALLSTSLLILLNRVVSMGWM